MKTGVELIAEARKNISSDLCCAPRIKELGIKSYENICCHMGIEITLKNLIELGSMVASEIDRLIQKQG